MADQERRTVSIFHMKLRTGTVAFVLTALFATMVMLGPSAQAQTYTVLHSFTGPDGANPLAGLTIDKAGISTEQPGPAALPIATSNLDAARFSR
jgi:hypothetical protein